VSARALSLCPQNNAADRREIIRHYWPFFSDDEHFACWCQLGFSFADGMRATILARYTRTMISDVARLSEGISSRLRNSNFDHAIFGESAPSAVSLSGYNDCINDDQTHFVRQVKQTI